MSFKEKEKPVAELVFSFNLNYTKEDKMQLSKLIQAYFRKRANYVNSSVENLAGALLWVYSRINFLFQHDDSWSQQGIAGMIGIKPKTISNTASRIMDALNIDIFDERFARKDVAEKDPRNDFFMTPSGFIVHKDQIKELILRKMINEPPKFSEKEDSGEITDHKEDSCENTAQKESNTHIIKNKKINEYFK